MLLLALLASGCAVTTPYDEAADPLESYNRVMYRFNDGLDRIVIKPLAEGYTTVVPHPARIGVHNFFGNLGEPLNMVNELLQGKLERGVQDMMRFIVNSTFGIFGLIDIAGPAGLPAHDEDFGQTFGVWGMGEGWYIVLPVLGPSTGRDLLGLAPDYAMDPVYWLDDDLASGAAATLRLVDTRAQLLGATRVRDAGATDPYYFTRESYRQHRWSKIHDGNPPPPDFDFE